MTPRWLVTSTLTVAIAVPALAQQQAGPDRARFSALWRLNTELSDKPAAIPGEEPRRGDRRREGGGGMRGGGMRGGGMGSSSADREELKLRMATRLGMLQALRDASAHFTLIFRESDGAIVITKADGRIVTFLADGKKYKEPLPDGGTADRVTRWKDGVLISELRAANLKVTQTHTVSEDGKRLTIVSALEAPKSDRQAALTRIYDRDAP